MRRNAMKSSFVKDVASSSQLRSKIDLQGLLELLVATTDINLQVKLFTSLSAYLIFDNEHYKNQNDKNIDVIIKCSAVYERIHNVLTNGLPRKATNALNFLSALLYVDAEEDATMHRRTLALYAKNMTRISGCLDVMSDLFTNCMMYHDTWKALCQCLSVACSGTEINQSYCTHLIPACIRKCSQTNIDIFLVLQSLVLNHKQNMQLFLDCNGSNIFTREVLHYDQCLQLLTTVVQHSGASCFLHGTAVLDDLRNIKQLYGSASQIGQKATIILNHIESRSKGLDSDISRKINKGKQSQNTERTKDISIHEVEKSDDTKILMQNVMKEIFEYKQNELGRLKKPASKVEVPTLIQGASAMNFKSTNRITRHKAKFNKEEEPLDQQQHKGHISRELSFTFLENNYKGGFGPNNFSGNETTLKPRRSNDIIRTVINARNAKTLTYYNIEKDLSDINETIRYEKPPTVQLNDFRPIISSTPKHKREISKEIDYSKMTTLKSNTTIQSKVTQFRTSKVQKRRQKKIVRSKDKCKDLRNRSLSSRFFSAINESCTTLVKTVVNIFKKKDSQHSSNDSSRPSPSLNVDDGSEDKESGSYSFLKYMQKRDAVLNNKLLKNTKFKNISDFSLGTKSCETCDDTTVLKLKLAKDEHLKQTVKKLKLGINMYGCDFKKISRTMWPRESYMTPVVLYNLYRKLLLK